MIFFPLDIVYWGCIQYRSRSNNEEIWLERMENRAAYKKVPNILTPYLFHSFIYIKSIPNAWVCWYTYTCSTVSVCWYRIWLTITGLAEEIHFPNWSKIFWCFYCTRSVSSCCCKTLMHCFKLINMQSIESYTQQWYNNSKLFFNYSFGSYNGAL